MEPIRYYGTGRRKTASARVWLMPGSGKILINGREAPEYLRRPILERIVTQPLRLLGIDGQYDIMATVRGGGLSGSGRRNSARRRARAYYRSTPNTALC
jgi:small subunit ribosomal protein S9